MCFVEHDSVRILLMTGILWRYYWRYEIKRKYGRGILHALVSEIKSTTPWHSDRTRFNDFCTTAKRCLGLHSFTSTLDAMHTIRYKLYETKKRGGICAEMH